jgi:SPP1 gp7 family putative phage head morphogenesis protein
MIVHRPVATTRPIAKASPDAWWRAIQRVADEQEPAVRQAFLRAVRTVQAQLDVTNLEDALVRGQITQSSLWDALASELDSALRAPLRQAVLGGAGVADRRLPSGTLRFDLTNPAAVQAVDRTVAQLVQDLTLESRQAIQALVRQSLQGAADVSQLARQIQATIGLTTQYAAAVERYRSTLETQGLPPGRAEARSQAYADRLLRHRAQTIARTEVIRATSAGQQAVWSDAQQEGLLPHDAQRVWIVTPDDRLCPICAAMEGQVVGVNEPFQSDDVGAVDYPPAHVACRCAVGIAPEES